MKRFLFSTFLSALVLVPAACAQVEPAKIAVPVKPIPPTASHGWTNALVLSNAAVAVVLAPSAGRLVALIPAGGDNLLRLDETATGWSPDPTDAETFKNLGGDWVWPVAQSRWLAVTGADWPPPAWVADRSASGNAWATDDGWQHARLESTYGAPVGIQLTREIALHPSNALVRIHQRITRTGEGTLPLTLWQISQVASPDRVLLPIDPETSAFTNGVHPMMNTPPAGTAEPVGDILLLSPDDQGMFKVGTDSSRHWIAAVKDDRLLLERHLGSPATGDYPDGGVAIEAFVSGDGAYVEIESLSVETNLTADATLANTIEISVHALESGRSRTGLIARVQALVGEAD